MGLVPRVRVPAGSGAERTAEGSGWRLVAPAYGRPAVFAARRVRRVMAVRLYWHDGVCLADGGSRWNSACPADGVCLLAASVRLCLAVSVVYPAQCSSAGYPSRAFFTWYRGAHSIGAAGRASVWLPPGPGVRTGCSSTHHLYVRPIIRGSRFNRAGETTALGWMDSYKQKLHGAGDGRHADPELHAG